MEIIHDCWPSIETYNCQYGAHLFDGSTAKIYVNHWLCLYDRNLLNKFSRKNEDGFVGHCLLVFKGVKKFQFDVTTYSKVNNETIWNKPVLFHYVGSFFGTTTEYDFEGSLHGFPSSVSIHIEAEKFELHILGKNEPAKEG